MNIYQQIWLAEHPYRSEEWLKERLADGFEVHHVDGNHANNHPSNLALIEQQDHMRLHGLFRLKNVLVDKRAAGRLGGLSSRKNLSPRKRRQLARAAAAARWHKEMVAAGIGK